MSSGNRAAQTEETKKVAIYAEKGLAGPVGRAGARGRKRSSRFRYLFISVAGSNGAWRRQLSSVFRSEHPTAFVYGSKQRSREQCGYSSEWHSEQKSAAGVPPACVVVAWSQKNSFLRPTLTLFQAHKHAPQVRPPRQWLGSNASSGSDPADGRRVGFTRFLLRASLPGLCHASSAPPVSVSSTAVACSFPCLSCRPCLPCVLPFSSKSGSPRGKWFVIAATNATTELHGLM